MAKYEHQDGKGRLFKNTDRKTDKHPHFSGNAKWKGDVIQISGWANLGDDGKLQSISIQLQEPYKKQESDSKDEW
jgi:hypothetical protein